MKRKILLLAILSAQLFFSQETISFETSEGYTLGDINGQNGWTVTETSDGMLTNQIVTDEEAKTGNFSFKNANVAEYDSQMFPIFGIEKSFENALDYNETTISYDFMAPQQNGADFEFAVYSVNENTNEFDILTAVGFENRGYIYIYSDVNFSGFLYANQTWNTNQWYNLKVHFTAEKVSYYLDNILIHEADNNAKANINGVNFLHNNFGGDAYYDNIRINDEVLAVTNTNKGKVNIYPNPVKDQLNIQLPENENVSQIEIYNFAGQSVLQSENRKEINLKKLPSGSYMVKVKNTAGKIYTSKIIKE